MLHLMEQFYNVVFLFFRWGKKLYVMRKASFMAYKFPT